MSRKAWDWVKLCKTSGSWDTAPFLSMLENKIFFQSGNFVILVGALFFYIPFHLFHFENKNFIFLWRGFSLKLFLFFSFCYNFNELYGEFACLLQLFKSVIRSLLYIFGILII